MEKMRADSTEFDVANRKIFPECCGTIENLSENQEYQFRVKAVNEVGDGEPSKPITAKIQDDESKKLLKSCVIIIRVCTKVTHKQMLVVPSCSRYFNPEVLQEQCHHCEERLCHRHPS